MGVRIQQLSVVVANQIAAGEVIERPASVVKECLENAFDAGADTITVDIGFGGLNQVKISDNGVGIVADDLPLAVALHATSKISQLSDLYAIASMGFRGEALASIAAVSKLSLSSRPKDQDHAMMLRMEGQGYNLVPCARSPGTTVEVRDLFFNAPVRKKFLKTANSEFQAIESVVKRFALSAPAINLNLIHNDKPILQLPAATCEKTRLLRVQKIVGKPFIEQAIYLDVEHATMHLYGWVSGKAYQRSQNDKQWFYINQRMVKDKLINHAIKQAYENILHPGRYPACILYLTLPPEEVDVNVHPTKHEVRFQHPRLIHDFITTQLKQAIEAMDDCVIAPTAHAHHLFEGVSLGTEIKAQPRRGCTTSAHEAYVKPPLRAVISTASVTQQAWTVLNTHFVLVFLHDEYYLVDISRVEQHRLEAYLHSNPSPLASRALMVPVTYTIDKAMCQGLQERHSIFSHYGIQFDWIGETTIVLRTLPTLLPQLNVKELFQRLNTTIITQADFLKLLLGCQTWDAYQLSGEDMLPIIEYLQERLLISKAIPGCLRLDAEKCRDIVYEV